MQTWKPLLLLAFIAFSGQQLLVAQDDVAEPVEEETSGGFFDLFGRKIDPETEITEGEMPAGPLKIVVDKKAPRFGSKRRSSSRSRGRSSRPLFSKKIPWSQKRQTYVNSGGGGGAGSEATHLVKSGSRVYLKSY